MNSGVTSGADSLNRGIGDDIQAGAHDRNHEREIQLVGKSITQKRRRDRGEVVAAALWWPREQR